MGRIVPLEQNTQEWHAYRRNKIGASMAPVIMGVSPHQTPLQLYHQLLDGIQLTETDSMRYGREKEGVARAWVNNSYDERFEPCVIQHEEYDWLIASLDGWNGISPLEIKTVNAQDWAAIEAGKIPEKHHPQIQMQLEVSNSSVAFYCAFYQGEMLVLSVARDEPYIKNMMKAIREFRRCLIELDPPPSLDRDVPEIRDPIAVSASVEFAQLLIEQGQIEERLEKLRQCLIAFVPYDKAKVGPLTVVQIERQGAVDYKAIPQLEGVDLDQYRKKKTISWRITHV